MSSKFQKELYIGRYQRGKHEHERQPHNFLCTHTWRIWEPPQTPRLHERQTMSLAPAMGGRLVGGGEQQSLLRYENEPFLSQEVSSLKSRTFASHNLVEFDIASSPQQLLQAKTSHRIPFHNSLLSQQVSLFNSRFSQHNIT